LRRAERWDGVVAIAADGGPLEPEPLARYLEGVARPPGFDVVAGRHEKHGAAAYEAAGATWLFDSRWPAGDWFDELSQAVRAGPPG
jgi:hypothetical protein